MRVKAEVKASQKMSSKHSVKLAENLDLLSKNPTAVSIMKAAKRH